MVTGAGGVLCSAMAKDLAAQGAAVAALGRTRDKLDRVVGEIEKAGGKAMAVAVDVNDLSSLKAARQQVADSLGPCDFLINGAGGNQAEAITRTNVFDPKELEDEATKGFFNLDMVAFHSVVETNIMGTVKPCQVFGVDMARKGRGAIINFASMNSYRPLTRVGAYGSAKAAIQNFTQWLAAYLAPAGVRVNGIAPGFFVNDRSRKILFNEDGSPSDRGEQVLHHTPMKSFGEAQQLLGCMNWLIDDEAASFVTGITVPVDGGFLSSSGL